MALIAMPRLVDGPSPALTADLCVGRRSRGNDPASFSRLDLGRHASPIIAPTNPGSAIRLLESLDGPGDEMTQEEWDGAALEEYRSRRAAHLSGEVRMIPADEALASVRARFARGS
jgi:hypothetical protein